MKILVFLVLAGILFQPISFADEAGVAGDQIVFRLGKSYSFTGTVQAVLLPPPNKMAESVIEVVDDTGWTMSFRVKLGTPIYDKSGMSSTVDKIAQGDKVTVDFKVNELGVNKAKVVRVIDKP